MPGVLLILRRRWAEVLLLVGLQSGLLVVADRILAMASPELVEQDRGLSEAAGFWLGLGVTIFAIVLYMMELGFFSSALRRGSEPQEPHFLLLEGRYFFWRMFRFQILLGLVLFAGMTLFMQVINELWIGAETMEGMPAWVILASTAAAMVVVLKPMVLIPAVMIVQDRMVIEGLAVQRKYGVVESGPLLGLAVVWLGVSFGLNAVVETAALEGAQRYAALAAYAVATSLGFVVVSLAAVRFVAGRPVEGGYFSPLRRIQPGERPAEGMEDFDETDGDDYEAEDDDDWR